jgi:hypothetical protein
VLDQNNQGDEYDEVNVQVSGEEGAEGQMEEEDVGGEQREKEEEMQIPNMQ